MLFLCLTLSLIFTVDDDDDCSTTNGKKCILKFLERNVKGQYRIHDGCVVDEDKPSRFWCSTKVDHFGIHIRGNYGWCQDECRIEGKKNKRYIKL